ncbi:hypothetical protein Tco_0579468 [Tanacetum coccineum]
MLSSYSSHSKIHKDHPKGQILGDPTSAVQTRGKIQKASSAQQALVSYIHRQNRTNHKDHQNCLFACFLSQEEPKTISQALQDESWVEAMQEELLQFKLQKVWVLVDFPYGKKARLATNVLTASRPDIMFAVCACARFQVTPKVSHLNAVKMIFRYALTHNPTIYDSLVKQFWQTATVRTLANGTQQLIASIDSTEYNITEASVRSKLQLADATGIHNLSDAEIYVGLATLGSYEAPLPKGNTSGSAEDSMQLKELMDIVPKLVTRIETLETELQQTKTTYGKAVLTLVKRVKILEKALKRKTQKVVISESEGEEPEDQGRMIQEIDDDPLVSLVRESMKMKEKSTDFVTPTKASGEAQEEDISPTILEAAKTLSKVASQDRNAKEEINTGREEINIGIEEISTGSTKVDSGTASKRGQREGKAPMVEEEIQATHKTKEQIRQEEAGLEEAIKLQAQMDEEVAKQIHLDEMVAKRMAEEEALSEQQKKRKAQVQFEAQYYTKEDWDAIRAKLEANAELTKDVLGKDLPDQDFAKRMVDMVNQRKKHFAEEKDHKQQRNKPRLIHRTDKEESVEAMNPTPLATKSNIVVNWKIFQQGQRSVYQIMRANGADTVYMSFGAMIKDFTREDLIELYRKYPLSKDACQVMLKMKLLDGTMDEVCYQLLKMIKKQAGIRKCVLANHHTTNGPSVHPCLIGIRTASPKRKRLGQTTTGKENSNPLIADSLLKTKKGFNALVIAIEALTSPKQTLIVAVDEKTKTKIQKKLRTLKTCLDTIPQKPKMKGPTEAKHEVQQVKFKFRGDC